METCHSISGHDDWGIARQHYIMILHVTSRDDHSKTVRFDSNAAAVAASLAPSCLTYIRNSESQPSLHFTLSTVHHTSCSLHLLSLQSNPLLRVFDLLITFVPVIMLRTGAVKALQAITRTQVSRQLPAFRSQLTSSYLQSSQIAPAFAISSIRCYSASAGLTKPEVQGRIMDLLKNFDKVRYTRTDRIY